MYYLFTIVFFAAHIQLAFGQGETLVNPRASGLAYASSTLKDEWAAFSNPAAAAGCSLVVASSLSMAPGFPVWNRAAAATTLPFLRGGLSAGFLRTGDALLNHQVIAAGYAEKIGIAALGFTLQMHQFTAEGYGTRFAPTISAGGITDLYPWLSIGAYVTSATQPRISETERLSAHFLLGASMKVSHNVIVLAEVEKDILREAVVKTGIVYELKKNFIVRTGFSPSPMLASFGFSIRKGALTIDYAFIFIPGVIARHQGGCSYTLRKK